MRLLWITFAVACSMPPDPAPEPARPEVTIDGPTPHEATPHRDEAPARAALAPDSACGRAERCCRAFAEVTPNVHAATACEAPATAAGEANADARCGVMIDGWRAALERHDGVEVPAACSAAGE